jgi:hypothetical protein
MAFKPSGELDPSKPIHVACVGKKGSGKSVLARVLFESYPYDRLVIDTNGTIEPAEDWLTLRKEPPETWPAPREDGERVTVHFIPDPGSSTFEEDMDRAVGLAYSHQRTMLWVDEGGVLARSNQVPAHTRRALHQGRHRDLSQLWCAPRPITMDPLVLAQADLVYVFALPNPADRRRVAETIGWEPDDLDLAVRELGQHEYLRYDSLAEPPEAGEQDTRLLHFPALPAEVIRLSRQQPGLVTHGR